MKGNLMHLPEQGRDEPAVGGGADQEKVQWGPGAREVEAIHVHVRPQNVPGDRGGGGRGAGGLQVCDGGGGGGGRGLSLPVVVEVGPTGGGGTGKEGEMNQINNAKAGRVRALVELIIRPAPDTPALGHRPSEPHWLSLKHNRRTPNTSKQRMATKRKGGRRPASDFQRVRLGVRPQTPLAEGFTGGQKKSRGSTAKNITKITKCENLQKKKLARCVSSCPFWWACGRQQEWGVAQGGGGRGA